MVLSSPSGGGKTSVIKTLSQVDRNLYVHSVSVTTRPAREGEIHGIDYYFVSMKEFTRMRQNGELIEWAEVHGYYYGTSAKALKDYLKSGKIVLLDIDIEGAAAIRAQYPKSSILIFINPPSVATLKERLRQRQTENKEEIQKRLQRFDREIIASSWFDYIVTNHNLQKTVEEVQSIIIKEMKLRQNN